MAARILERERAFH